MLKKPDLVERFGEHRRDQIVGGVARELSDGMRRLESRLKRGQRGLEIPAVFIAGTARTDADAPECKMAFDLGRLYARCGFGVITGGGDRGVMSEANRAAKVELSIGVNIGGLPHEVHPNPHQDLSLDHLFFETREMMFYEFAIAHHGLGGGFGTLREMFSVLTLIQCGHLDPCPVFFMDSDPQYWQNMVDMLVKSQKARGHIGDNDLKLFEVTNDIEYVVTRVARFCHQQFPGRFHDIRLPNGQSVTASKPVTVCKEASDVQS
jgi:uncharacterized protein (TIGR00730 family)